jgi:hypothetical protein
MDILVFGGGGPAGFGDDPLMCINPRSGGMRLSRAFSAVFLPTCQVLATNVRPWPWREQDVVAPCVHLLSPGVFAGLRDNPCFALEEKRPDRADFR